MLRDTRNNKNREKMSTEIKTEKLVIEIELIKNAHLGDIFTATAFTLTGEELAAFEIIVHRHGGAYMGRQLSGEPAPSEGKKYVHEQVAKALGESVAF